MSPLRPPIPPAPPGPSRPPDGTPPAINPASGPVEQRQAALRNADLGPASRLLPPQPGGDAWAGLRVTPPFDHFPPATAFPIDMLGDADIATSSDAVIAILSVDIPAGQRLRIKGVGWASDSPINLSVLFWSIQTLQGVVPGFDNRTAGYGTLGAPADVFAVVSGPNTLFVAITTFGPGGGIAAGALTMPGHYTCRLVGWLYSNQLDPFGR